jgi:hypothetical protein
MENGAGIESGMIGNEGVPFSEIYYALTIMQVHTVRQDEQRVRALFSDFRKGAVQVFGFAYVMLLQLDPHCLAGGMCLPYRGNMKRIKRIKEHRDMRELGHHFTQKLEPLTFEVWRNRT